MYFALQGIGGLLTSIHCATVLFQISLDDVAVRQIAIRLLIKDKKKYVNKIMKGVKTRVKQTEPAAVYFHTNPLRLCFICGIFHKGLTLPDGHAECFE